MKKIAFSFFILSSFYCNDLCCIKRRFPLNTFKSPTKQRRKNIYNSETIFRLSRSKIELYYNCPRCFYLNCKLGIRFPAGYPLTLNNLVDELCKREFDFYRNKQEHHPYFKLDEVSNILPSGVLPFKHARLDEWRNALNQGITYRVPGTNLEIVGGIDDLWVTPNDELIVVDYKATSKRSAVTIDEQWQDSYKRQVEIYQWLFRKNGFNVLNRAYFLYYNGRRDSENFGAKIEFDVSLLAYDGDTSWIDAKIYEIYRCLQSDSIPKPGVSCQICEFALAYHEKVLL